MSLRATETDDAALSALAGCEKLAELDLRYARVLGPGLKHLAKLPALAALKLGADRTSADRNPLDLTPLSEGFAALRSLEIAGNDLGDSHIDALGERPGLRSLTWRTHGFSNFTDAGIARLAAAAPDLEDLSFNGAQKVTGAAVPALAKLEKLAEIDIGRTAIGPAAAPDLAKIPSLKKVVSLDSLFNSEGAAALKKLRPEVEVAIHGVYDAAG